MRTTALVFAMLSVSGPAGAQQWEEYVNTEDGFRVNFPGQPTVTETTWQSQLDYVLPARVYSADRGPRALLGDRGRLHRPRTTGHRAGRGTVLPGTRSAVQTPVPSSVRGTGSTTNEGRSCMRRSSFFSGTPR